MIPCALTFADNITRLVYWVLPAFAQHLVSWSQYIDFVNRCLR